MVSIQVGVSFLGSGASGAAIFGNPGDAGFMPGDPGYTGTAGQEKPNVIVNVNPSGSGFIGNQDDFLRTVQLALQIGNSNGYSLSRAGNLPNG